MLRVEWGESVVLHRLRERVVSTIRLPVALFIDICGSRRSKFISSLVLGRDDLSNIKCFQPSGVWIQNYRKSVQFAHHQLFDPRFPPGGTLPLTGCWTDDEEGGEVNSRQKLDSG